VLPLDEPAPSHRRVIGGETLRLAFRSAGPTVPDINRFRRASRPLATTCVPSRPSRLTPWWLKVVSPSGSSCLPKRPAPCRVVWSSTPTT